MIAGPLPLPACAGDPYPERRDDASGSGGPAAGWRVWWPSALRLRAYRRELALARARADEWHQLDAAAWGVRLRDLRARLMRDRRDAALRVEACAATESACRRVLGLRPFDNQWIAALVLLDGQLAEMATGEGKTLSAGLAAAVAALAGVPVHLMTANDYLVRRDAEMLAPLYGHLGLTSATVCAGDGDAVRRRAYRCDVVHATAREIVFDYLRDESNGARPSSALQGRLERLSGERPAPLLRGLHMALLDEADAILLDEARVPLILSAARDDARHRALLWQSASLAAKLEAEVDYRLQPSQRSAVLSATGSARLAALAAAIEGTWLNARHREELVATALAARHLYARGRDYLVRDGEIVIIDPVTGRGAEGRQWSRGLHGLIALKEGCKPPPETETLNQITYQRFFPRYLRIGGMSGSLREVRGELAAVYGLGLVEVPLRLPSRRARLPRRLFARPAQFAEALSARVAALRAEGRAVLVGSASVAESLRISEWLGDAGVAHRVLNAEQSREEAMIVAEAGRPGSVTVATNMAGRGTDIRLDASVAAAGGLHVINCQLNRTRRLDRQLAGRCARQGDPGSAEHWLCLEDFRRGEEAASALLARLAGRISFHPGGRLAAVMVGAMLSLHQHRSERRERRERARMLAHDVFWEEQLLFGAHRFTGGWR